MKATKLEKDTLTNIIADVSALAALLEMGAVDTKEKLFVKIDELIGKIKETEVVPE